jgi:hypothetical protein
MTDDDQDRRYDQQVKIFESLIDQINLVLEQYGKQEQFWKHAFEPGEYSIYEDYLEFPQVKVSVSDLKLLRPKIVAELQQVVRAYPGWEIVVAVAVPGHYKDWPEMGLFIRSHEIIDGLQRQYFPMEFRDVAYEGGRRGTVHD